MTCPTAHSLKLQHAITFSVLAGPGRIWYRLKAVFPHDARMLASSPGPKVPGLFCSVCSLPLARATLYYRVSSLDQSAIYRQRRVRPRHAVYHVKAGTFVRILACKGEVTVKWSSRNKVMKSLKKSFPKRVWTSLEKTRGFLGSAKRFPFFSL